ncbi:MAG: EAL domain-containing protein, partial [Pseudomonadota bacterium]
EVEAYLTALRNSGNAVHAHQIEQDLDAFKIAIRNPADLILYTSEAGEIGINGIQEILEKNDLDAPLLVLAENCDAESKAEIMSLGAKDLIERNEGQLLAQVILREYSSLLYLRNYLTLKQKLTETEERCNLLTEHSRDAIGYIYEGMHVKANSAYLQQFGLVNEEDIEGLPILDMVAPSDHQKVKNLLRNLNQDNEKNEQIQCRCLRADGIEFNVELSFHPATIDGEPCFQITILNQSSSREVEDKLKQLSTLDTQTNLYNRQHFLQLLEDCCQTAKSSNTLYHLFYITLDNFREIRDQLGILISDGIINEAAPLLKAMTSEADVLARFGDHTFTLLTRLEQDKITEKAESLRQQIEKHHYPVEKLRIRPTCSIGIVKSYPSLDSANEFINAAYQACEQARIQGGNQFYLAEEAISTSVDDSGSEADLEKLILHALEEEQFRLFYQPIVSLHGDTRENYAVLIRLLDNNQEEIQPRHFLNQAESMGKQQDLDRWVIRKAISEISRHRSQGSKINFFINISGSSLDGDSLLLWICDCLQEFDAKGSWLTFQIHDPDARNRPHELKNLLDGLKKIKCKISIDQFGLAPKPEAILHSLPVDYIQFSQELIEGLSENQDKQDKLYELNSLVQNMYIKTIASGIDETNSLAVLWSVGVNYIRGYFIQEPTPTINYDFKSESTIV